jgi:uncharacterized protein
MSLAHSLATEMRALVARDFAEIDPAHDITHLDRVWRVASVLADSEGGDLDVLAAAAYLHDYHRVLEYKDGSGRVILPGECEPAITRLLRHTGLPASKYRLVLEAIAFTDNHSFAADARELPELLEGLVLSDADNLDALGAIGLARAFVYGGHVGEPIWAPEMPSSGPYMAGHASSIVHHLQAKVLRLRDDMRTQTGRQLAESRHAFVLAFVATLTAEWLAYTADPTDVRSPRRQARPSA